MKESCQFDDLLVTPEPVRQTILLIVFDYQGPRPKPRSATCPRVASYASGDVRPFVSPVADWMVPATGWFT